MIFLIMALLVAATIHGTLSAGDNTHSWDLSFARWIQGWDGGFGEALYNIGDLLGTTALAAVFTMFALIIAVFMRQWHVSIFLFLVLLFRLLGTQLKPLFDSPRPASDQVRLLEAFDGTGYPSGHSMTAAMVGAMFVVMSWRYLRDSRFRALIGIIAIATIILVGWSRVWSGAHWPSDVLGGWSYGIALVLLAWIIADLIVARFSLRRDMAGQTAKGS